MDMSNNPHASTKPQPLPGEPHNRDLSNPGEVWAFVLAAVLIAALVIGFLVSGLAGVGVVMVALVPVIYIVLVTISVGR
jgi:hypothetical protein